MGAAGAVTTFVSISGVSAPTASHGDSSVLTTDKNVGAVQVSAASGTATLTGQSSSKDADANIDATDIMIEYANAGLTVRVARENVDSKVYGSDKQDQTTTSIGASYKMGDITFVGYQFDVDNGAGVSTNDTDGWFVGAKMAMGANTFGIGYSEEDDIDTTSKAVETGKTDKNMMISVDHALSKRTSITAAYEENEDGTAGANNDRWAVGLKHVF
jgi:predicted porin